MGDSELSGPSLAKAGCFRNSEELTVVTRFGRMSSEQSIIGMWAQEAHVEEEME
jgi:hypothetical protein